MTYNQPVRDTTPKTQMSIGAPIGVFLIQVLVSLAALLMAIANSMMIASCGSYGTTCDYDLATVASYMTIIVVVVAFVGALIWCGLSRIRGAGGIWGPVVGSAIVIVAIAINTWLNAIAIPALFGPP